MSCVDINLKKWIVFIILCYSVFLFINIGPMYFTLLDFPSGSCHDQNPQSSSVFSFSSFPGVRMKIEGCVSTPAEAVAF